MNSTNFHFIKNLAHLRELRSLLAGIMVACWLVDSPCSAEQLYHLTRIPMFKAYAINDNEQIVGEVDFRPVFWSSATGLISIAPAYSVALDMNNSGQVVGYDTLTSDERRAFIWTSANGLTYLEDLPNRKESYGYAINDSGQIAGYSKTFLHESSAVRWTSSGVEILPNLLATGGMSQASVIDNSGSIAGISFLGNGAWTMVRWTSGTVVNLDPADSYDGIQPNAVNGMGHIVGVAYPRSPPIRKHAFIWRNGRGIQQLGSLLPSSPDNSSANDINDAGQVVGTSQTSYGTGAFIWTERDGIRDLNDLVDSSGEGWTLREAHSINNRGQVVVYGTNSSGGAGAFLLTPPPPLAFTEFSEAPLGASLFSPSASSTEMGFVSESVPTSGTNPFNGIALLDGTTNQVLTHRSVNAITRFVPVELNNFIDVEVSLSVQVAATSYEVGDQLQVYVTDGTRSLFLMNHTATNGSDELDGYAGDGFFEISMPIPSDWNSVQLVIASSSNSTAGAERFDFDKIKVLGEYVIPEPPSSTIAAVAVLLLLTVRLVRTGVLWDGTKVMSFAQTRIDRCR